MNFQKIKLFAFALAIGLGINIFNCDGQIPYKPNNNIVKGGQYKDLILPMPVNKKLTSKNIWGGDNVLPRNVDNGVEGKKWAYWGGNPMLGKDSKYHVAIARWKEETGHWGWPKSEIAHAVSKNPTGPYKVTGTIIPNGHNPEVIQLNNGNYILHISGAKVYTSKKLKGPWQLLGKLKIDERGFKGLTHLETNLTGVERKDGSFLFFTKRGDVMISDSGILGPFKIVSAHNYSRYTGYPEDPVIWKSRYQYHVIYNHAIEKKSVYMRSLDGIHWTSEPGVAYDKTVFRYTDGTKNTWVKFERPKVIQDKYGRATYLTLGVIDVEKHLDLGNDNHNSKQVVLPLETERLVNILNTDPITPETKEIKIIIKAEKGFNPLKDIDINSLRLGSSSTVNYGGGAKVLRSESKNNDLIIIFDWQGEKISDTDYDLKLLGKKKDNSILFAYALLPGFTADPSSLVTLPVKIEKNKIVTAVDNFGLKKSSPCKLLIYKNYDQKREKIKEFDVPSINPYGEIKFEVPVRDIKNVEYEAVIMNPKIKLNLWNKVDDSNYTAVYKGEWKEDKEGKDIYMGSERVSSQPGNAAIFFFTGIQARCYGHLSKEMGSCDVFIDNNYIETIDCYFSVNLHNFVLYQTKNLPYGLHKLELRVTGKHYKRAKKAPVAIDAFSYR